MLCDTSGRALAAKLPSIADGSTSRYDESLPELLTSSFRPERLNDLNKGQMLNVLVKRPCHQQLQAASAW